MRKLYAILFILFTSTAFAQNPTVVGDSMLCPNSTGLVGTQPYDTYQWFVRYFGSSTISPITGATSQYLPIGYADYAASYLSVEVTTGSNDYISPEFFVDGWAFAGMTVMSTGDFTIGPFGESVICPGDTMFFEVLQPYDTNITWFNNNDTIPGMTGTILTVTDAGVYFVTGAPSECPAFITSPGVDMTVIDCTVGINENDHLSTITTYPNPANDKITIINHNLNEKYIVANAIGQIVMSGTLKSIETVLDIQFLQSGIYYVKTESGTSMISKQ